MDRLIVEYLVGFSFDLFIFQSLFMKRMMGGRPANSLEMQPTVFTDAAFDYWGSLMLITADIDAKL